MYGSQLNKPIPSKYTPHMSSQPSFVTIRGKAISLETQTESFLSKYSTFAQTTSSEQTGQEKKIDKQLEEILSQRQDVIDSLTQICDSNPAISASKLSQLQRHKEILQDHWKSFRNIRSSIQQERNRLNLLFSVKNDIANSTTDAPAPIAVSYTHLDVYKRQTQYLSLMTTRQNFWRETWICRLARGHRLLMPG